MYQKATIATPNRITAKHNAMKIKDIYINATTTEMLEREFAFAVDLIICLTLAIFP